MPERIKGQEVSILVTRGGDLEAEITDCRNVEFTYQFEIKSEGYLGEKQNRKDTIYNGIGGSLEYHFHSGDVFDFVDAVKAKARRETPDVIFNISGVFAFPSGEVRTLTIADVQFGPMPISLGSRDDYASWKLDIEADDAIVQAE